MTLVSDSFLSLLFKDISNPYEKTHLSLNSQSIVEIALLKFFKNVQVLDLRDNYILSVSNLSNQSSLTHLYLQNNLIGNLESFGCLRSLQVLFLDHNKIEVVENLGNCPLEKLSVKGQNLPVGQCIGFDPLCLKMLDEHLEEINVSGNRLTSIRPLCHLLTLERLEAGANNLRDLSSFCEDVSIFRNLKVLNINNNPISEDRSHVKEVISACKKLDTLGSVVITPQMRKYCERMVRNRKEKSLGKSKLEELIEDSISNLATVYRPQINRELLMDVVKRATDI